MFFALVLGAFVAAAAAAEPAQLHFRLLPAAETATLVYSNNPEQLFAGDLCDSPTANPVALLEETVAAAGSHRHFWEYLNQNDATVGFAVVLTNAGSSPVSVQINGAGTCANWVCGGDAIADMFNRRDPAPAPQTVAPGADAVLLRVDAAAARGQITTGVLDVTVAGAAAGNVTYRHLAFTDFAKCDLHAKGEAYVTRTEPNGENEGSTYKGIAPHTVAMADGAHFAIAAGAKAGDVLPVAYPRFNLTTHTFGPPLPNAFWITNIGPHASGDAVVADMVAIDVPGFGWMPPDRCCDGRGAWPNFGNWGIEYRLSGTVANADSADHVFAISFPWPGCDSAVAWQCGADAKWDGAYLYKGDSVTYVKVAVPAGSTVPFAGRYMLGGPACGGERSTAVLLS